MGYRKELYLEKRLTYIICVRHIICPVHVAALYRDTVIDMLRVAGVLYRLLPYSDTLIDRLIPTEAHLLIG